MISKSVILLFGLTGCIVALQAPLHYEYNYYGSVGSGIPELSNQMAGWAMKSEVHVYIEKNDGTAIVKLKNFKMADFHEKLGCDSRDAVPDQLFYTLQDEKMIEAIGAPYRVNLFGEDEYAIEYGEEPYKWLINMRKGLASLFKNEILKSNIESTMEGSIASAMKDGHVMNVFSVNEESVLGKCKTDYTIHPIPKYLESSHKFNTEKEIVEDIQMDSKNSAGKLNRNANVPEIGEELWHVVKSVDLDHCRDRVAMQVTPTGFYGDVSKEQFQWMRSRSSVTEYIFRGSPGNFRLERAILEGSTMVAPMGIKTELLQTIVNQTVKLVRVTSEETPTLPTDLKQSKNFMYHFKGNIPAPAASRPIPWMDYPEKTDYQMGIYEAYGAERFTEEQLQHMKELIKTKISEISMLLTDFDQEMDQRFAGNITAEMSITSSLMMHMSQANINEILEHFNEKDFHQHDILAKKLAIDAVVASSTWPSIEALFGFISAGKVSSVQIMTIFMTLTSNVLVPVGNLYTIMNYVLKLDLAKEPFLTSTVLINFADIIHETCIKPDNIESNGMGIMLGDLSCSKEIIENKFAPYLKDIIYSDETTWEKNVAIRSLMTLGLSKNLEIFIPVIEGKVKCPVRTRTLAIYALQSWRYYQDHSIRSPIIDFLTDIYSNLGEHPEVRKAALGTLISWRPDPAFWYHIARLSWREPSAHVATYMSTLIESMAKAQNPFYTKQNQAAFHALKLAKPIAPSMKYSMVNMMATNLEKLHASKFELLTHHSFKGNLDSEELFYFVMTNLGGFQMATAEIGIFTQGIRKVFKMVPDVSDEDTPKDNAEHMKTAKSIYDTIEETIHKKMEADVRPELDIFVKMMDHMHLYLPINKETISTIPLSDPTNLASFMVQLGLGYDLVLAKFFRPILAISIHVSEIGLPVIVSGSTSILYSETSFNTLTTGSESFSFEALKKLKYSYEVMARFISESTTSISVLLPWTLSMVGTGVNSVRDILLPIHSELKNDHSNENGRQDNIEIRMKSLYKTKFPVFRARNAPYTSVFDAGSFKEFKSSFKPIFGKYPKKKEFHLPNTYAGIDVDVTWNSEISLATVLHGVKKAVSHPEKLAGAPLLLFALGSLSVKFWSLDINVDPELSKTKDISITFAKGVFGKKSGQFLDDVEYDYGSESFEEDETEDSHANQLSYKDTMEERSEKLQKYFGTKVKMMSVKFTFEGEEIRSYEFLYSYSMYRVNEERKGRKARFAFIRSPVPGVDDEEAKICLDVERTYPSFWSYKDMDSLYGADLKKKIKAELKPGCSKKPIASVKGIYQISDKWKEIMKATLPESCDYDSYNPLYSFKTHAVYNDVKLAFTWRHDDEIERDFPITSKVMSGIESLIDIFSNDHKHSDDQHQIKFEASRCSKRGTWYIDIEGEGIEHKMEDIPHDELFNWLFSAGWRTQHIHQDHISSFNTESESCIVGIDSVRTFDGVTYDYEPTQCWTVAAKDCLRDKGKVVLVRSAKSQSKIPEVKYIDMKNEIVVEFANDELKVNGEIVTMDGYMKEITKPDGKELLTIYKISGSYFIMIKRGLYVSLVKEKLKIHVPKEIMGFTCGLCGNFDGEKEAELVGPRRCFYDDSKTFAASWVVDTADDDSCSANSLDDLKKEVSDHQESCITIDSLLDKCPDYNHRNYKFSWAVHETNTGVLCVSSRPVPHCGQETSLAEVYPMPVKFTCWPIDRAPQALQNASKANLKYIDHPIMVPSFYPSVHAHFNVSNLCKSF